jgi:hypothetical protein
MKNTKISFRIKEIIYLLIRNQPSQDQKQANNLEMLSLREIWNKVKGFRPLKYIQILSKLKLVCNQMKHSRPLQTINQ